MASEEEEVFTDFGLDAPVILEVQIGFQPKFNKQTEAQYEQIRQELKDYIREKYKDILIGIETVFYEINEEVEQDQEIQHLTDKTLH